MDQTFISRRDPDGKESQYQLHPEMSGYARKVFERDIAKQKKVGPRFMRPPYDDLHESELICQESPPDLGLTPDRLIAVLVIRVGTDPNGDPVNARMPMGLEEMIKEQAKEDPAPLVLDQRTIAWETKQAAKSKGFGRN